MDQEEYKEYLENEKQALRNCFMKTRSLPGIPLHDVAQVLVEELSKEEMNALLVSILKWTQLKQLQKDLKGGENT